MPKLPTLKQLCVYVRGPVLCDFCLFLDRLKLVQCQKLVQLITSKCLHGPPCTSLPSIQRQGVYGFWANALFSFSYCLLEVMSSVPCTLGVLPSLLQVNEDVGESMLLLCLAQAMMMDGEARDKDVEEGKVASQLTRSDVSTPLMCFWCHTSIHELQMDWIAIRELHALSQGMEQKNSW